MAGVWILNGFLVTSACWIQLILGTCSPGRFGESCLYTCHCGDSCNQTTGVCGGGCDAGWVGGHGANCQKENVAYKRTASSPTRLYSDSWSADKAVDGNRDQDVYRGSCFNAADATWGLWKVDLGKQYRIHDVKIYQPSQFPGRIRSCVLYLSNTSSSTGLPCYAFPSDTPENSNGVYSATCDGIGRYFSISNATFLSLCEVEIYVCSRGLFGETCNEFCHCAKKACDHVSGFCPGDCRPGWQGDRCDTECNAYHYGLNCVNTCTDRKCSDVNSSCDRYIGSCDSGCVPGWRGVDCSQECSSGSYGQNCSDSCSDRKCAGNSPCDHTRGACVSGCAPGWMGEDCRGEEARVLQAKGYDAGDLAVAVVLSFVVGVVVGAVVVCLVVWWRRNRRPHKTSESPQTSASNARTNQSQNSDDVGTETRIYDSLHAESPHDAKNTGVTYCTIKSGNTDSEAHAPTSNNLSESVGTQMYENIDNTSREMDGAYSE
ncbi:multiple epidermal growth factor-like domains protein 10 isoform X3 [Haliotis rubra]|uniref:multiple epidermal growth factor-like domains protein 10 isoform X3 n=1 Tax=Haliotis rubra TaxID=36100 RepID=UPI001EE5AD6E|nr:multiple epidermal growth factor-like domains protein 10 isoform X3 [Haliotis rubra]